MLTRLDMAKIIAQAKFNLKELPTETNKTVWNEVQRYARMNKTEVKNTYNLTMKVIEQQMCNNI